MDVNTRFAKTSIHPSAGCSHWIVICVRSFPCFCERGAHGYAEQKYSDCIRREEYPTTATTLRCASTSDDGWKKGELVSEQGKKSSWLPTMTSMISTMSAVYITIHIIEQALLLLLLLHTIPICYVINVMGVALVNTHAKREKTTTCWLETDRSHYLQCAFMPIWHKIELRRKIMVTRQ